MNLKRSVLLGLGGAAIALWIAAAASSVSRPPSTPARVTARAVETSGAELASEIARLHERLRPSATPIQSRNLFRYTTTGAVSVAPTTGVPVAPAALEPALAALPPSLKLVGIAEEGAADAILRTAIIAGFGDLFMVTVGDAVTLRYRVSTVGPDAVELLDAADQTTLRLTLK